MILDPKLVQWISSGLLLLSGVQGLAMAARFRGMGIGLRLLSFLIALAAIAFGILMIVNLLGGKA